MRKRGGGGECVWQPLQAVCVCVGNKLSGQILCMEGITTAGCKQLKGGYQTVRIRLPKTVVTRWNSNGRMRDLVWPP